MADILIIDDEPGVLGVLRRILEGAGHSVSEAPNGEVALQEFEGKPADLVITDIFMPEMDGIEFLVHLRTTFPDAKVLAVPTDKLSRLYRSVQDFRDLPEVLLGQIAHFFEHYKDLDEGKWVRVEGWGGIDEAKKEILDSVEMYQNAPEKPNF